MPSPSENADQLFFRSDSISILEVPALKFLHPIHSYPAASKIGCDQQSCTYCCCVFLLSGPIYLVFLKLKRLCNTMSIVLLEQWNPGSGVQTCSNWNFQFETKNFEIIKISIKESRVGWCQWAWSSAYKSMMKIITMIRPNCLHVT